MDPSKFKKGLEVQVNYDHLRGHLDTEALLEDLGIDFSYRKGDQLMCHCPNLSDNHSNGDANPSWGFHEAKLKYNCFVCGGGDPLELVQMMKPEITDDQTALEYLETFSDYEVTADNLLARIERIKNSKPLEPEPMPDYPTDSLFQYRKIHPWLYERGLTKDVIVDMQIGYDDEHAGITIPHFFMGKLVGLQRRHLLYDAATNTYDCPRCDEKKIPKYKNTAKFPKVNTLYGYDQMKRAMKEEQGTSCIVVESPLSKLKLQSLGFNRSVASFGSFSKEQAMLLIAIPTVYYWPDNDPAGYENAKHAIEHLSRFVNLMIVPCVPEHNGDPGDIDLAVEIKAYLNEAYPASLFEIKNPNGKLFEFNLLPF